MKTYTHPEIEQCVVTCRGVGKRLAARSSIMVTPGADLKISLAISFRLFTTTSSEVAQALQNKYNQT